MCDVCIHLESIDSFYGGNIKRCFRDCYGFAMMKREKNFEIFLFIFTLKRNELKKQYNTRNIKLCTEMKFNIFETRNSDTKQSHLNLFRMHTLHCLLDNCLVQSVFTFFSQAPKDLNPQIVSFVELHIFVLANENQGLEFANKK